MSADRSSDCPGQAPEPPVNVVSAPAPSPVAALAAAVAALGLLGPRGRIWALAPVVTADWAPSGRGGYLLSPELPPPSASLSSARAPANGCHRLFGLLRQWRLGHH